MMLMQEKCICIIMTFSHLDYQKEQHFQMAPVQNIDHCCLKGQKINKTRAYEFILDQEQQLTDQTQLKVQLLVCSRAFN